MNPAKRFFDAQQPELILYDLDGTLVDSVPDLSIAIDRMLTAMTLPEVGEARVRLWVGNGIPSLIKRALANDIHGDQSGWVEEGLFQQAFIHFKAFYGQEVGQHSHLYPGVSDFLSAMAHRGVMQAVVTNKSQLFTDKLLQLMGIEHHFALVLGGDALDEKLSLIHI